MVAKISRQDPRLQLGNQDPPRYTHTRQVVLMYMSLTPSDSFFFRFKTHCHPSPRPHAGLGPSPAAGDAEGAARPAEAGAAARPSAPSDNAADAAQSHAPPPAKPQGEPLRLDNLFVGVWLPNDTDSQGRGLDGDDSSSDVAEEDRAVPGVGLGSTPAPRFIAGAQPNDGGMQATGNGGEGQASANGALASGCLTPLHPVLQYFLELPASCAAG